MERLLEGFDFDRLFGNIKWDEKGLVPAVTQDYESGEVLMLAYMNKEALKRTLVEGKACYYSRSRQELWLKGETSGHYQEVKDISFDCDKDTILLKVIQTGMACHENYFSCFHYGINNETENKNKVFDIIRKQGEVPPQSIGTILEILAEIIHTRKLEKPVGAYTTYLFEKGIDKILKKVGEESAEVIIAAKNNSPEEIRYETADLFYHLLVMLEDRGVSLREIAAELNGRRK
ncbi:MAG: bifunctional phosphoribosyl-AMP cyclohydrolase/phosphoribosyl-ATP diphosphatase HisIE [Eubacteriales bacterium]